MKARISSVIATAADRMWEELQKPASLLFVASPILIFKPLNGTELSGIWQLDRLYKLRLSAFGIIPLGRHSIIVKTIDPEKKEIFTNEGGALTRTWNHYLHVEKIDDRTVRYTDQIDIEAGVLTIFIWMFAHAFYRHRQRRWRILLNAQRDTLN